MAKVKYDAKKAPEPKKWLELTDDEMLAACEEHHLVQKPHPPTPNPKLHAALHAMVEKQLAMNFPPQAREALQRLISEGLTRHEAVHAVGSVIAYHMAALEKGNLLGPLEYADELDKMNAEKWRSRKGSV